MTLENILLKCANNVLDLPKTNDPIGKPIDDAKQQIKDLMMELLDSPVQSTLYHIDDDDGKRYEYIKREELRKKVAEL